MAQDAIDAIQSRLAQPAVLRGDFAQQKQIAGFRNPLKSSGRFLLAKDRGVVWTTLAPFPSTLVVTADSIRSRLADGGIRVEVDAAQQPALATVNSLLFALFSGDIAALSQAFDIAPTIVDDSRWTLALTPRTAALATVFQSIELQGDTFVRHVRIEERSGDVTQIEFGALGDAPATLGNDEAQQFD